MFETRKKRFESGMKLLLCRCRKRTQGATVKRVVHGDDFSSSGLPLVEKILASEFDRRFNGLCSAVAEKYLVGKTQGR